MKANATYIVQVVLYFVATIRNKKPQPCHRTICVTCKLEKQFLRGFYCTENDFYETLKKHLENLLSINIPLRRVILVTLQVKLYLYRSP